MKKKATTATLLIIFSALLMLACGAFSPILEARLSRSLFILCFAFPMGLMSIGLLLSRSADIDRRGRAGTFKTILAFFTCFFTAAALVSSVAAAF